MAKRRRTAFLHEDMIHEILCRSPVKTLIKLTCVSKFFRNLITCDRRFVYSHLSLSPRHTDVMVCGNYFSYTKLDLEQQHANLIATLKNKSFSNPFYLGHNIVRLVGSCNGIICFLLGIFENKVYLWNPSLHQIRDLTTNKKINDNFDFFGFGYDYKNKQHKFVHISSGCSSKVEIYSLENNFWKSFSHDLLPINTRTCVARNWKLCLEFNGSLHWISSNSCILTFGLSDGKISEFPLPKSEAHISNVSLGVVNGCLSVLTLHCRRQTIWSMMNANNNNNTDCSWTKTFEYTHELSRTIRHPDRLTANGKITTNDGLYDPETKTWKQYLKITDDGYSSALYPVSYFIEFVESLVSVNQPPTSS